MRWSEHRRSGTNGLTPLDLKDGYSLERVDRSGPALVQQPRERAVGQDDAARLAARAVVAFVLGVNDALHRRSAHRAGLSESAVRGHFRSKGGDALGESPLR